MRRVVIFYGHTRKPSGFISLVLTCLYCIQKYVICVDDIYSNTYQSCCTTDYIYLNGHRLFAEMDSGCDAIRASIP